MKELKLRVWNKFDVDMYYQGADFDGIISVSDRIDGTDRHLETVCDMAGEEVAVKDNNKIIPMLFIGRQDDMGKDIYENDILNCGDFIGKVTYNYSFAAFIIEDYLGEIRTFLDIDECEVIGNTFENPGIMEDS
jgi:uncharacterized phage protein (TIGR01671 family)